MSLRPLVVAVLLFVSAVAWHQGATTPNDPYFEQQVSFHSAGGPASFRRGSRSTATRQVEVKPGVGLDLPQAWQVTTGSRAVVVALLDDGFPYAHEDVAENVWRNPGEIGTDEAGLSKATNGRDDDRNGYADDVVGYDFVFDDPDPDAYVFDGMDRSRIQPYWHSIQALGIIGAVGNNGRGVAGVNWQVSLMLLKIGAQGEQRTVADSMRTIRAAKAIRYAVDNRAQIINWSGYTRDTSTRRLEMLRETLRYAEEHDVLFVSGAGNDGLDNDDETNCVLPQCFDGPASIRVAELEFDGALFRYQVGGRWRGSSFGRRRVEVAALGQNFTTDMYHAQSTYSVASGTSNAGPVVAGVAALMLAANPRLHASELRTILMETVTRLPALEGKIVSGGTVNADRAVRAALAR